MIVTETKSSETMSELERADDGTQLWRYVAVDGASSERRGELAGATAADVRASLRRVGLNVLDIKPARRRSDGSDSPRSFVKVLLGELQRWWHVRVRATQSRGTQRAEIYDGLATMLISGLPLLEAVNTLLQSRDENQSGRIGTGVRSMLFDVRERLRGGDSLSMAMVGHPSWFDDIDIAIVESGQHSGTLPSVLRALANRQERSSELMHRVWGALAYPLLVALVGLGVVVFLSIKTLPDLAKILADAGIPIPGLTVRVMWVGQTFANHWLEIICAVTLLPAVVAFGLRLLSNASFDESGPIRRIASHMRPPRFVRHIMVGRLIGAGGLADLLRNGVPVVEALRIMAPAQQSLALRRILEDAAQRLERGEDLAESLAGTIDASRARPSAAWFDAELRRLIEIGQVTGELDVMLERLGERYQRRAKRLIDRMTVLLEPAVLLLLAGLVGTVVMAAVLPLIALQEIMR